MSKSPHPTGERSFFITMFYYIFAPAFLLAPFALAQLISEATSIPYPISIVLVFVAGIVAYRKRHQIKQWIINKGNRP